MPSGDASSPWWRLYEDFMTTENEDTRKIPANDVSTDDNVPVAQSDELSNSELDDVAGGMMRGP